MLSVFVEQVGFAENEATMKVVLQVDSGLCWNDIFADCAGNCKNGQQLGRNDSSQWAVKDLL